MPHITRFEREAEAKLKTKWWDYLNYMLILNLLGILGFALLVIYSFSSKTTNTLFWIGFILALIELIVFEISNVVFKLHCFFIELYKNIQLQEEGSQIEVDVT